MVVRSGCQQMRYFPQPYGNSWIGWKPGDPTPAELHQQRLDTLAALCHQAYQGSPR